MNARNTYIVSKNPKTHRNGPRINYFSRLGLSRHPNVESGLERKERAFLGILDGWAGCVRAELVVERTFWALTSPPGSGVLVGFLMVPDTSCTSYTLHKHCRVNLWNIGNQCYPMLLLVKGVMNIGNIGISLSNIVNLCYTSCRENYVLYMEKKSKAMLLPSSNVVSEVLNTCTITRGRSEQ